MWYLNLKKKNWRSFKASKRGSADDDDANMRTVTHDHSPM